jgi:hypothetical protein
MPNKIYEVKTLDERWNSEMLAIVANSPIESNGLHIVFDHSPDMFFIPGIRSKEYKCAGLFIRDELCGFAMMLVKEVYINGQIQKVHYFGNMVVKPSARGRGFLYRVSDCFLKNVPNDIKFGYAVILHGNVSAKRHLNRFHLKYPNMPYSKISHTWRVKNILPLYAIKDRSKCTVRHAKLEDIDGIAECLNHEYKNRFLGPVVTRDSIIERIQTWPDLAIENYYIAEYENEIVGVCCVWDMNVVKKNRVVKYNRRFKIFRSIINLCAFFFGYPGLPSAGESFRDVTITDYAVRNRDPEILRALLVRINNEYRKRKYHMIICGCADDDPLQNATRGFIYQSLISDVVVFSKSEQVIKNFCCDAYPFIDMTLL